MPLLDSGISREQATEQTLAAIAETFAKRAGGITTQDGIASTAMVNLIRHLTTGNHKNS